MDKELLFKPRLPEEEMEIAGVGTVRVRGLNRDETIAVGKIADVGERDRHLLAMGMVDPKLSVSDVKQWNKAATGGELEVISRKIAELSGMLEGSDKAAYKSVRGESGFGVRTLPGSEALDDGGPSSDGDE